MLVYGGLRVGITYRESRGGVVGCGGGSFGSKSVPGSRGLLVVARVTQDSQGLFLLSGGLSTILLLNYYPMLLCPRPMEAKPLGGHLSNHLAASARIAQDSHPHSKVLTGRAK
eukprot:scaffold10680_cov64-Attheya_sp.AAC.13